MPGWRRIPAGREDILARLALAEQELWSRGGLEVQQARRHLLDAAMAAGCTVMDVAEALCAAPADVRAWLPTESRGLSSR
jgi:hypothetical protein